MVADLDRVIGAFDDAVEGIDRLASAMSAAELASPSRCPGWTNLDVIRHLRSNVRLWNERLDLDEQGMARPVVVDTATLDAQQLQHLERAKAAGVIVLDTTEENNRRIGELAGENRDRLIADFRSDARRVVERVRSHGEPLLKYYVIELHLHADDLAVGVGSRHTPSDPQLLGSIWREHEPEFSNSDPWSAMVRTSGRSTDGGRVIDRSPEAGPA